MPQEAFFRFRSIFCQKKKRCRTSPPGYWPPLACVLQPLGWVGKVSLASSWGGRKRGEQIKCAPHQPSCLPDPEQGPSCLLAVTTGKGFALSKCGEFRPQPLGNCPRANWAVQKVCNCPLGGREEWLGQTLRSGRAARGRRPRGRRRRSSRRTPAGRRPRTAAPPPAPACRLLCPPPGMGGPPPNLRTLAPTQLVRFHAPQAVPYALHR